MNADYFNNKTVWITGASSGIGRALAIELASMGAKLILSARDREGLETTAHACRAAGTENISQIEPFDISEVNAINAVVSRVLDLAGSVDILVNNAGVGQRSSALDCSPEVVKKIMQVNFLGPVVITQQVVPYMIKRKSGRIVVVASVLGKFHMPGRSAYSASKHALKGYFSTLRTELHETGVGVTLLYPGWIATSISNNALTQNGKPFGKATSPASEKMSAEVCAKRMVKAIAAEQNEATMGGAEIWGGMINCLFPRLYEKIIRKRGKEFLVHPTA